MKIIIDEKNRATVAIGRYNGRTIKSVCICHEDDTFDESFGTELAKKKWKLKQTICKQRDIDSAIRELQKIIYQLEDKRLMLFENQIKREKDIFEFNKNYFEGLKKGK